MPRALGVRGFWKVEVDPKFLSVLTVPPRLLTLIYVLLGTLLGSNALAEVGQHPSCYEDAMLIFDASGSMSGMEEYGSSSPTTRIDDARAALAKSLPHVTPYRRIGLMTYGPGRLGRCENITLNIRPQFNAGPKIMAEVNALEPDGFTPLTSAVAQAANVLDYRNKPALVVLFTDGEETCDGNPCELAEMLKATGKSITVHVIGYRMKDIISARERGVREMKCLASETGGRFISADSIAELVDAFNATLGCPLLTQAEVLNPILALAHNTGGESAVARHNHERVIANRW